LWLRPHAPPHVTYAVSPDEARRSCAPSRRFGEALLGGVASRAIALRSPVEHPSPCVYRRGAARCPPSRSRPCRAGRRRPAASAPLALLAEISPRGTARTASRCVDDTRTTDVHATMLAFTDISSGVCIRRGDCDPVRRWRQSSALLLRPCVPFDHRPRGPGEFPPSAARFSPVCVPRPWRDGACCLRVAARSTRRERVRRARGRPALQRRPLFRLTDNPARSRWILRVMEGNRLQCGPFAALVGVANPVTVAPGRVLRVASPRPAVVRRASRFSLSDRCPGIFRHRFARHHRQRKRHPVELARSTIPPVWRDCRERSPSIITARRAALDWLHPRQASRPRRGDAP